MRQLASVAAVAEHRSFSAAARALNTVQSNVSTHVSRLERELCATLIDRQGNQLTDAGKVAVAAFRRAQAELDTAAADIAALTGEVFGTVRLGVIGTVGRWLVPVLLASLAESHPRVHTVVVDATTTSLIPQLLEGRLDLAVVNLPVHDPDVAIEPLMAEDHVVVAPADHPLAQAEQVTLQELSEHALLLEPPGTGFRDALDADAARAGQRLQAQAEVDGMRLVASIAFQGRMPAVLPASAVPDEGSAQDDGDNAGPSSPPGSGAERPWRRVALVGTTPRRVGLAIRKRGRPSPAALAVLDATLAAVADEVPKHAGVRLGTG